MIRAAILLLILLINIWPSWAMGPRMKESVAIWDPSPEPEVTGYWLYWGTGGVYTDSLAIAKEAQAGTHPAPSVDLMAVIGSPGIYQIAVTAHDQYFNESDFSNSVSWIRQVINSPVELKITEGQ